MPKQVKTTRIEKKFKDKKTGEWKSLTIDYAKINDRLLQFREVCPRGRINTKPTIDNGKVIFEATIIKDAKDPSSAEATGHAYGELTGDKAFEKLETIAVGRALALLGYGADGAIASAEEMEEFQAYQEEMKQKKLEEATDKINGAETVDELKNIWASIEGELKTELVTLKDTKKNTLCNQRTTTQKKNGKKQGPAK